MILVSLELMIWFTCLLVRAWTSFHIALQCCGLEWYHLLWTMLFFFALLFSVPSGMFGIISSSNSSSAFPTQSLSNENVYDELITIIQILTPQCYWLKFTESSLFASSDGNHMNVTKALFNFNCQKNILVFLSSVCLLLETKPIDLIVKLIWVEALESPPISIKIFKPAFPPRCANRQNM